MLRGRLGLETARIPHADRHGLLWLSRGALTVRDGTLRFDRNGGPDNGSALENGEYGIPFQSISMILLGPGSTVSHDALRLMARHGTALVAVGEDGVRCYTAPPLMPDTSDIARKQMQAWGDAGGSRITIARKMYAMRLGEVLPHQNIEALRGIEGARMKRTYQTLAQRFGIQWRRRRYDRNDPLTADIPNQDNKSCLRGRHLRRSHSDDGRGCDSSARVHPRAQWRGIRTRHRRPLSRFDPPACGVPICEDSDGQS